LWNVDWLGLQHPNTDKGQETQVRGAKAMAPLLSFGANKNNNERPEKALPNVGALVGFTK